MQIEKDKVVSFHYSLKDESGEMLEQSFGSEPMVYLHGHGGIIVGLEKEMAGKQEGERFAVTVAPEYGYGLRSEDSIQRIPIKHLHNYKQLKGRLRAGMIVSVETEDGPKQVQVIKAGKFNVDVDANHPLAGKILSFDIEIQRVRDASAEEIAHGHVHGEGGHHH